MQVAVTPAKDAPPRRLYTTIEETPEAMGRHAVAWEALAAHAVEPNPFYEPFALLAAWSHLAPPGLRLVLVWAPNVLPGQPPLLAGLFPIVREDRYKGLPITVFSTWAHFYMYFATPLVRAEFAPLVLETFFGWLRDSDALLFRWKEISSGGAFRHALIDTLNHSGSATFQERLRTRAYFQPAANAERYFEGSISGKKRKELRRQERRLGEKGTLRYDQLAPDGDLEAWLEEFLELEAQGWKGRKGTALKNDPAALGLFRAYARGAFERGRWMTLALRLDGRAIAMKCNLLAGNGAVAFKIAYDETYAQFSPGVLLEIEHIRRLHEPGAPAWMDSGAAANHPMIDHLWSDRVAIETLVVPTGRRAGELAVATMPLARWTSLAVKKALHRLRSPRT